MGNLGKRIVSVVIVLLILLLIFYNAREKVKYNTNNILEKHKNIMSSIKKPEIKEEKDLEKTGTLDNLVFIVDITNIKKEDETYIVIGNTSTEEYYSGEIHIETNDIENIKIYNTYKFIVEPIISFTKPPMVKCIHYDKATIEDINKLHENRKATSTFNNDIKEYGRQELIDIINNGNKDYTTWTNDEINKYLNYIVEKGYTDDFVVKNIVKIISIPIIDISLNE